MSALPPIQSRGSEARASQTLLSPKLPPLPRSSVDSAIQRLSFPIFSPLDANLELVSSETLLSPKLPPLPRSSVDSAIQRLSFPIFSPLDANLELVSEEARVVDSPNDLVFRHPDSSTQRSKSVPPLRNHSLQQRRRTMVLNAPEGNLVHNGVLTPKQRQDLSTKIATRKAVDHLTQRMRRLVSPPPFSAITSPTSHNPSPSGHLID